MENYTLMTLRISAPKDILEPIINSDDYKTIALGKRVSIFTEDNFIERFENTYTDIEIMYFEEDEISSNIENIYSNLKSLRDDKDEDIEIYTFDCLEMFGDGSLYLNVEKSNYGISLSYGDYKYFFQNKIKELHESESDMPIGYDKWFKSLGKECLIDYLTKRIEEVKQEENIENLWH
jgi:hypothetical protein